MISQPLITLAIPTYNRRQFVTESIEAITSQLGDFAEVVVCDNASEDGTFTALTEFSRNDPRIRVFQNPANLGPDRNTLRCLREARGRYIHFLADDDILLPGALLRMREFLSVNGDFSVLHINFVNFKGAFADAALSVPHHDARDIIEIEPNEFVRRLSVHATLYSATVLRREEALSVPRVERFIGSWLLQSHLAVACVCRGSRFGLIGTPGVAVRGGNSGGYSVYRIFGQEWKNVLFGTGIENGLTTATAVSVYDHTIRTFMRSWAVQLRTHDTKYESSGIGALLRSTWDYPSAWIYVYPFLLAPAPLIRVVKAIYDRVRER